MGAPERLLSPDIELGRRTNGRSPPKRQFKAGQ